MIQNSVPKLVLTINPTTPKTHGDFCNLTEDFQRLGRSSHCIADSIFLVNLFIGNHYFLDKSFLLKVSF